MDFFRRQNWDLVGRSWFWFSLSGVLLLAGLSVWAIKGLNLGIDFTGGGLVQYQFARPIATDSEQQVSVVNQVKTAIGAVGLGGSEVLVSGNDQLIIRTPPVKNDAQAKQQEEAIRGQLDKLFAAKYGPITSLGRQSVGPVIGAQLRTSAIHALILGVVLILLYITIRYEFKFAIAAIVALMHDVFMVVGAMALFRLQLDSAFVAVILTVIGFSVHDTIVIFDRIRENMKLHRRANFADTVNASLLQTMTRSINTVVTVLFTLVALAVFGSGSIRVFSIGMVVGIVSGAYSSIFNASQIVVVWDRYRTRRLAATGAATTRQRDRQRLSPAQSVVAVDDDEEEEEEESEVEAKSGTASVARRRLSAQEAMERAERAAQEQKRADRRERRKKAKDKGSGGRSKSKKRF